jgi:hypothetical protein
VQFTAFLPAISNDALKKISAEVRSWRLHRLANDTIDNTCSECDHLDQARMHVRLRRAYFAR